MKQSIGYKSEKKEEDKEIHDSFKKQDESIAIRKIENGYIVTKSWTEGKGQNKQYKSSETYYEKNPVD